MKYSCFCFLATLFSISLFAQSSPRSLTISNTNNITTLLSAEDIKAMPHTTTTLKAHDEKMHEYSGVTLYSLLQKAGVSLGDSAKKKTAGSYVLITAADNYQAVYALAEVDTIMSDKTIILADAEDGKPLPPNALPYQIIATGEKIHARMIRQVVSIAVRKAE